MRQVSTDSSTRRSQRAITGLWSEPQMSYSQPQESRRILLLLRLKMRSVQPGMRSSLQTLRLTPILQVGGNEISPSEQCLRKSSLRYFCRASWSFSSHFQRYFISRSVFSEFMLLLSCEQRSLLISMRQLKSPIMITSRLAYPFTNSDWILPMVALRQLDSPWWAARWQLINCNGCPMKLTSRLMAPLLPTHPPNPALIFSFSSTSKCQLTSPLTSTARCSPFITFLTSSLCPMNTSMSASSHWFLASQQKDMQSERSHYWVAKTIRSGVGLRERDWASQQRQLWGGMEPQRFHVMATMVKDSGCLFPSRGTRVSCYDLIINVQTIEIRQITNHSHDEDIASLESSNAMNQQQRNGINLYRHQLIYLKTVLPPYLSMIGVIIVHILMTSLKTLTLTLFLIFLIHSEPISVLQAGSLVFSDQLLRKNTCMLRPLDLPFDQAFFNAHPDLGAVAVISSLQTDDALALQFYYHIECSPSGCFLDFRLQRISPEVTSPIPVSLKVDYIVGHGIRTATFNMTEGRKSLHANAFNSHPQSVREFDLTEWDVVMIPNGFNHVSLTGQIKTTVTKSGLVVKLEENPESWSLGFNFIQFTAVLLPKGYLAHPCGENLQSECQLNQITAFMGSKSSSVDFKEGEEAPAGINSMALPFEAAESMVELRVMQSHITSNSPKTMSVQKRQELYFVILLLVFIALEAAYLFYKKYYLKKEIGANMPDMLVSLEAPTHLTVTPATPSKPQQGTGRELKEETIPSAESKQAIVA